ncbi:hypothetical protein NC652_026710 [Populus alba x Populus x berolinensis]|nr:hypothetical protein NC652_026710 [Populus alba x Populus x berolinensis]
MQNSVLITSNYNTSQQKGRRKITYMKTQKAKNNYNFSFKDDPDQMAALLKICRRFEPFGVLFLARRRSVESQVSTLHSPAAQIYNQGLSLYQEPKEKQRALLDELGKLLLKQKD